MADLATLVVNLRGDISDLKAKMTQAQGQFDGLKKGALKLGGVLAGAFAAARVGDFIKDTVRLADIQLKAESKVRQGIIATGKAAGLSADELFKVASQLQRITTFGDEQILNDVTAQFITFKNISGDVFLRAQKSALDLATVLDGDLKGAAIQLGKALNDPAQGLTALRRSGVTFSESQIEVIKNLQQTNRLAEAQTIILKELESQYGGQAEAAAKAGGGGLKQFQNALGDIKEEIGKNILPALTGLAQFITDTFLSAFKSSGDVLADNKARVDNLERSINPLVERYEELNKKSNRSAEEQKELNTIIEKIAKVLPSAATGWDSYGNAIGISTEKIAEYVKAQKDFLAVQNETEIEKLTKRLADQKQELGGLVSLLQRGEKTIKGGGGFNALTETVRLSNEELKTLNDRVSEQRARIEQTQNAIKGYRGELDPAADSVGSLGLAIEEVGKKFAPGEIDKESEAWKRFAVATEEAELKLRELNFQKDIQASLTFDIPELDQLKGVIDGFTKVDEAGQRVAQTIANLPPPSEWLREDQEAQAQAVQFLDDYNERQKAIGDVALSTYAVIGGGVETLVQSFLNGKNGLKEFGKALADFVKQAIAKLLALAAVAAVVSALLPGAGGFGKVFGALRGGGGGAFDILKLLQGIPKFASGGIVTRPTLGLMGEAGPEAILPLSKLGKYAQAAPQTLTARVEGQDLLFILEDAQRRRGNTL